VLSLSKHERASALPRSLRYHPPRASLCAQTPFVLSLSKHERAGATSTTVLEILEENLAIRFTGFSTTPPPRYAQAQNLQGVAP